MLLLGLHFFRVGLALWRYSSLFCMLRVGLSRVRSFLGCGGLWAVLRVGGLARALPPSGVYLLGGFGGTLLVVSILGVVCDCSLWSVLGSGGVLMVPAGAMDPFWHGGGPFRVVGGRGLWAVSKAEGSVRMHSWGLSWWQASVAGFGGRLWWQASVTLCLWFRFYPLLQS